MQMDNVRGLLGIRGMDKVLNARIRELCGVTKGIDANINEGILRYLAMRREWRMIILLRGST